MVLNGPVIYSFAYLMYIKLEKNNNSKNKNLKQEKGVCIQKSTTIHRFLVHVTRTTGYRVSDLVIVNMSSGLQRRRGQAGHNPPSAGSATTAEETPHVIGYDPKDVAQSAEGDSRPPLTLMEELLLIGLDDDEGVLSMWNDSISYVLRGCILIELALRGNIKMTADSARKRVALPDRLIELVSDRQTGEALLDETIKLMRDCEPMSVTGWVDCLSGETWNFTKIGYQLKQVRERLAKGLVDKGICRTEKRNYFLFDMATHPMADFSAKGGIRRRIVTLLTQTTTNAVTENNTSKWFPAKMPFRMLRTLAVALSAYVANVIENLFSTMSYDTRDAALLRVDEMLSDYAEYPFLNRKTGWASATHQQIMDECSGLDNRTVEVVAAVFSVYTQLDAVL